MGSAIELNGKRYDVHSGAFLGSTKSATLSAKPAAHPVNPAGHARSLDGFIAQPSKALAPVVNLPVKPAPHHPVTARPHHAHSVAAHQPQPSKTLMRHTVKVPAAKPTVRVQAPAHAAMVKPAVLGVKPKLSSEQIDPARSTRALNVPRSQSVARFQPQHQATHRSLGLATAAATTAPAVAPASQLPVQSAIHPKDDIDLFERAIIKATSHEQPAHKESRRHQARRGVRRHMRTVSIVAAACAMLLLGGFVAYQNKVAIELQLASAKAGFPASMPDYRPSGYAAKTLQYGPGSVSIGFRGDSRSYTLTQDKSDWDSETLLQNYVADANQPYQAYQAGGRTVYVYGNGNATWVNGGVWYKVSGNANLDTQQIIDLATSM